MHTAIPHRILDRCGVIQATDPMDSYTMAEKLTSMISYEMIMNYDPKELSEIMGQKGAATETVGLITYF